jgi:hypothetical protein
MPRVTSLPALLPLENFFFHSTTMDTRGYGRVFGFNNPYTHDEEEAMALPPPTITRRSGKIPRSPIP